MNITKGNRIKILINDESLAQLGSPYQKSESLVLSILKQHADLLNRHCSSICKRSPETTVTLVKVPKGPVVCVKEYHWRGLMHAAKSLFRTSHGKRTFFNGLKLREKGIHVPIPMALVQRMYLGVPRTEWVIMEVIPRALELDRYLLLLRDKGLSIVQKRDIVRQFGEFMGRLHRQGIFHSDLKICNILVTDASTVCQADKQPSSAISQEFKGDYLLRFFPIDYDDVSFSSSISERQCIKNLVQLFLSTPLFVTFTDRVRFLRAYGRVLEFSRSELRRIAQKVVSRAWGQTILYVSPTGDIVENWTRVSSTALNQKPTRPNPPI